MTSVTQYTRRFLLLHKNPQFLQHTKTFSFLFSLLTNVCMYLYTFSSVIELTINVAICSNEHNIQMEHIRAMFLTSSIFNTVKGHSQ